MTRMMNRLLAGGSSVNRLRHDIRHSKAEDMRLRRAMAGVALLGIGSMAVVSLYQSGLMRHLPDPERGNFHSDKVNASDEAFGYGMPDAPLAILAHATSLALSLAGPADRSHRAPWVPLIQAAMNASKAFVAAKYLFYQMPKVDKAWCPYCIVDALTHFAALALSLPEATRTVQRLLGRPQPLSPYRFSARPGMRRH